MTAPCHFDLGDRMILIYDEGDTHDEFEIEVMLVHEDGAIDVARLDQRDQENEWWSILPGDWGKYWTLQTFTAMPATLMRMDQATTEVADWTSPENMAQRRLSAAQARSQGDVIEADRLDAEIADLETIAAALLSARLKFGPDWYNPKNWHPES